MESKVYTRMASIENRHWWFVARRRILAEAVARYVPPSACARVLEAGCGTGGNLALLSRCGQVFGFEPHRQAREYARRRGPFDLRDGRLPYDIPFEPGSFDLVAALDVLEHLDDDRASLAALADRLKPGGKVLITVPAFPFLWSHHDEQHHHRRRYRKRQLIRLIRENGLEPEFAGYFNSLLFPLVAGTRLAKRLLGLKGEEDQMPPPLINRFLTAVLSMERHLLGRLPMPFGVSILVIARKPGNAGR